RWRRNPILELDYIITEKVTGYTNTLRQLRAMLGEQGGEIVEFTLCQVKLGKGKHYICDTSSCILFMRASDLYVIGYESEVELESLKPDKERAQEIGKYFANRDLRGRVEEPEVRPLSFKRRLQLSHKDFELPYATWNTTRIFSFRKAVKILGGKFDSEKQTIFIFLEATQRKGLAAAVEEKPRFLNLDYIITGKVTEYTNPLRQLRAIMGPQRGEISGIHPPPSETEKGKAFYVTLHLRCDMSSCILFTRASYLYVIGYDSEVQLLSLKPDKERTQEMDANFVSSDLCGRVEETEVRPLSFIEDYNSLIKTSILRKVVKILGEVTRFTNFESYITINFKNDVGSVWMFSLARLQKKPHSRGHEAKLGSGPEDIVEQTMQITKKGKGLAVAVEKENPRILELYYVITEEV
ncbi:4-alpha-glucan-branching enzyme 2-2, partial [Striga asiatica]